MMSIVPRYSIIFYNNYSCSIEIIIENVPYSSIFYNFYQDIHVLCLSYFLGGKSPRLNSGFGSRVAQSNTNHRSVAQGHRFSPRTTVTMARRGAGSVKTRLESWLALHLFIRFHVIRLDDD